jgi:hypothetical protein
MPKGFEPMKKGQKFEVLPGTTVTTLTRGTVHAGGYVWESDFPDANTIEYLLGNQETKDKGAPKMRKVESKEVKETERALSLKIQKKILAKTKPVPEKEKIEAKKKPAAEKKTSKKKTAAKKANPFKKASKKKSG